MTATQSERSAATVLVVEDDRGVRESLAMVLEFHGLNVVQAVTGEDGVALAASANPDLILLDLNLPGIDGIEACRRIRVDDQAVAILMLTARDGIAERVRGLDSGADDYLPKPFALDELLARVRALLRSAGRDGFEGDGGFGIDDLRIDRSGRQVWRGDQAVVLTKREFDLLELLVANAGAVITRDAIQETVWGYADDGGSNSLEVFVSALRKKTEVGDRPRLIHTVRGVGYVARSAR